MTTVTFTSSGSWAAAASVVDCQAWGEGGNGGTSAHGVRSGGGGGGGECAEESALAVSGTINFIIGSGGTGTDTSFPGTSVTVTAHHGINASGQNAGAGGTGSSNATHNDGGTGGTGVTGSNDGGSGGGGSGGTSGSGGTGSAGGLGGGGAGGSAGAGGGAAGGTGGANTSAGNNGNAPGSGAGGGGSGGAINHSGGTGASGQIVLIFTSSVSGTATLSGTGTLTAAGGIAGQNNTLPEILPGPTWLRRFARQRRRIPVAASPPVKVPGQASLSGAGTMGATGTAPQPAVINQWAGGYGQGTTFTSITSALQSAVIPLTPASSVGGGSGVPTAGNWLFCIASWTQNPQIAQVHIGTGDDIHSYWREYPASSAPGNVRTAISYTSNTVRQAGRVYVAPDMEIAAINVLVVEISGLGPWDTVTGMTSAYNAASTSLSMSLSAPSQAAFIIAALGGDNISSGQAFPDPYNPLISVSSPQAWWKLGDAAGSGTAADASGNGRTGTATSVTFGVSSNELIPGNTIASFSSASTSHIQSSYNPALSAVTVEAWVNLNGLAQSGAPRILANSNVASDNKGFQLLMAGAGNNTPQIWFGNGTSFGNVLGLSALAPTGWVHLAATWNGTTITLYVNGISQGTGALSGSMPAGTATGIGIGYGAAFAGSYFSGLIAECAIYSTALTATQVFQHYQAGAAWTPLVTQTQTNGSNALADNILSAAVLPSTIFSQSVTGMSSAAEDMSGFMLGVQVSAASPIPAGHNPDWPLLIFEAGLGSGFNTPDSEITWTDLTSRLWNWDETSGIQFQLQELQATNLEIQADNFDLALTSSNTGSPYYPNVVPGTPLRLRMALGTIGGTTVNRWYILQRNAQEWTEKIDEQFRQYVNTTGTDLWNALSGTPPTFYRSEVTEDSPYAWWPLDDQPGTAGVLPVRMLNAAVGNTNTLNVTLSPNGATPQTVYDTLGNPLTGAANVQVPPSIAIYGTGTNSGWMFGDPVSSPASLSTGNPVSSQPGSASWQQSGHAGTTGSFGWFLTCHDASFPSLANGITLEGWFNYQFLGSGTGYDPAGQSGFASACQQPFCPLTLMELATAGNPVAILQLDLSGHLNFITYNGSTPTSHSIYTASDLRSESWFMVTVTMNQNNWTVWINGGDTAQVSGTGAGMTSAWSYLIVNADFGSGGGTSSASVQHSGNASISHIAVYPVVLPYYRVLDHYWAAVTAFGQIPAPSGVAVQWAGPAQLGGSSSFTPDGSLNFGNYLANSGPSASAVVVASIGGSTSGPSAWTASAAFGSSGSQWFYLWAGWTGVASAFKLYTSSSLGNETQASVVAGAGDSFSSGYGAGASGHGVAHVSSGNGSSPPSAPSAIGDTVGQRIERLMRNGKFSSPQRCIDQAPNLVQAPGSTGGGTQAGTAIQAIQQSDDGMLFIDNTGRLTYWERPHLAAQYSSPVWQIGPSAGKIPYYKQINWVTDPHRIYNVITIAPLSPTGAALPLITPSDAGTANSSQIRYGAQPLQVISYLQDATEMQAQADWLLMIFGTPRRRAEQVFIDAAAYPAAWPLVLGINVGDVVTLEDWIIGGGGAVYTMRVTEIKRRIDYGTHNQPITGQVTLTLDFEPTSYWS